MNINLHLIWIQSLKYSKNIPLIPIGIYKNYNKILSLNNNISFKKMIWYNENIIELIKSEFPDFLKIYISISDMRYKSDLARLIILYKYGGIYIDVDQESLKSFLHYDNKLNNDLLLVLNSRQDELSNGFIYVKNTENKYIKMCIINYVKLLLTNNIGACKIMKEILDNYQNKNEKIVLIQERPEKKLENCSTKDEFWKSFYIYNKNNEKIMKSRYDNYYSDRNTINNLVEFK